MLPYRTVYGEEPKLSGTNCRESILGIMLFEKIGYGCGSSEWDFVNNLISNVNLPQTSSSSYRWNLFGNSLKFKRKSKILLKSCITFKIYCGVF